MRPVTSLLATLILFAAAYAPPSLAADDISTMAKIVVSLQHFPSTADKEALAAIASGGGSDSVKAVANAIARISHKAGDPDIAALTAIAADDAEPQRLRRLAQIVVGIDHMPTAEDKVALGELAAGS